MQLSEENREIIRLAKYSKQNTAGEINVSLTPSDTTPLLCHYLLMRLVEAVGCNGGQTYSGEKLVSSFLLQ